MANRGVLLAACALAATFAVGWWHESRTTTLLRERVALYERVVDVQDQWCSGIKAVNEVCSAQLSDIIQRLGVDSNMLPAVTTALWRRWSGMSAYEARKKLGGRPSGKLYGVGGADEPALSVGVVAPK